MPSSPLPLQLSISVHSLHSACRICKSQPSLSQLVEIQDGHLEGHCCCYCRSPCRCYHCHRCGSLPSVCWEETNRLWAGWAAARFCCRHPLSRCAVPGEPPRSHLIKRNIAAIIGVTQQLYYERTSMWASRVGID